MTRRPTFADSMIAQLAPAWLGHCDPGSGTGYRIAFYGDGTWDQVETDAPVMTHAEARALIAAAADALIALSEIGRAAA